MELGITEKEHNIILNILKEYFDNYAFYYYGSRIKGTFNKTSDLDILIQGNQEMPLRDLVELKEKFDESKLPYIVNFTDYNSIDEKFYNLIKDDLVLVNGFEVRSITVITKERKEYLLNNLLLFMKNEMEDIGGTKDTYWFVEKFPEEVYYMGVNEPQLEPASEDTAKFISKYPCEKKELEVVIKYAITHELLERFMRNSYKITYLGIDKADEYEEYLEECVSDNQIILNDYIESPDNKVNEKMIKCRNLYLTNDIDGALENIWDAFERLKTIYTNIDKKASIKKICKNCATSLDFDNINSAFEELTYIGNNYQIRHFETNKKQITDNNTKVYLYFRMLTLITFAIKQLGVENDL